jgi:hypothetical protein
MLDPRIILDGDGDLWIEIEPDIFHCETLYLHTLTLSELTGDPAFAPIKVYGRIFW